MRAKKVDANHGAVRDHLRAIGWSVFDTSPVGRGFPDLVCARRGFTALVEVKDGHAKHLNPEQQRFVRHWNGVVIKAISAEDAEVQLELAESHQVLQRGRFYAEHKP